MFELIIIISRYVFIIYVAYFLLQGILYVLSERQIKYFNRSSIITRQRVTIVFMHISAFLILAYTPDTGSMDMYALIFGGAGLFSLLAACLLTDVAYKNSCPLMWNGMFFLFDIGLIMIQRLEPYMAQKQLIWFGLGFAGALMLPLVLKIIPRFEKLEPVYLIVGFVLLLLPIVAGSRIFGAANWITLGIVQFQPSEVVKFLFVFYLASVFRKKLSFKQIIFPTVMSAVYVLILVIEKDLGGALVFFMTYLILIYISTGSELLFFSGLGTASLASVAAYNFFTHIKVRVSAWQNPLKDIDGDGYQIMQSLFAIGTWGMFGSGLTRGYPKYIPVVRTDFIFSAICEEFGPAFGIGMIGVYILIFYRGVHIALRCKRRYYSLLAAGFTSLLAFQTFLILGGVIKLIPMTGVTLPFVSYGGSSITVCIMMIGILEWVYRYNEGAMDGM